MRLSKCMRLVTGECDRCSDVFDVHEKKKIAAHRKRMFRLDDATIKCAHDGLSTS